jgi:D-sedoheptulose 7-phosphate isomerase
MREIDEREAAVVADLVARYPQLAAAADQIIAACGALTACFSAGGKLLICGNGGSAADSDHIVGELMKGFLLKREIGDELRRRLIDQDSRLGGKIADGLQKALPAISLAQAGPLSTAFANDASAELCFAQQVLGYGRPGDALLCISTSGNSRNVLFAAITAKSLDLGVIGMTGMTGGALAAACDILIQVPETETYRVQELHLPAYHAICRIVEEALFR